MKATYNTQRVFKYMAQFTQCTMISALNYFSMLEI